ncbi:MAG: hypothetical protein HOW73_32105 [Polyangiaceae bacterium]|nr:hypothetical protein [Polyangiaceae bacterium]
MKKPSKPWMKALVTGLAALAIPYVGLEPGSVTVEAPEAHAIIGRPLTPVSYAGVARRTVRRTTYATAAVATGVAATAAAVSIATLPHGCAFGGGIYTCGAVRYRAVYDGPNVVYVQL